MLDKCEWCDKTSAQIDSLEFELETKDKLATQRHKDYCSQVVCIADQLDQLEAKEVIIQTQYRLITKDTKELEAKDQEIDELKELVLFKDKFSGSKRWDILCCLF